VRSHIKMNSLKCVSVECIIIFVLAQKQKYDLRPEFGLLESSLIGTAFSLFIRVNQPAGNINEYLISISTALLGVISDVQGRC
jgi:hypothetical protein